jgi:ribonuclease D
MREDRLPDPIWVNTPAALKRMAADLGRYPMVAVDTESNGLHAYQEQVCLLQFSTGETDYLVDPLSLQDLSSLGPLFANPAVEKVFHAAEYDILCLKRDFGFRFVSLFDTMQAARILGRKEMGLGNILAVEFGLDLDKRYQRSNWGRRPLTPAMQAYARLDSHYLIELRERLRAELEEKDLLALAQEDFQRLCQIPAAPLEIPSDSCWKVAGSQEITPRQAAILQSLCDFRDQQARYANLPTFRIVSNQVLLEIALADPQSIDELSRVPGLTGSIFDRHGLGMMEAIERGEQAEPLYPSRNHRPGQAFIKRLEELRKWRKEIAQEWGVESDVVLPRDVLVDLAETNPQNLELLSKVMVTLPWRLERFGPKILHVLAQRGKKE